MRFVDPMRWFQINATDKVNPADPSDDEFSCGVTLGEMIVFAVEEANIRVNPVNQPPSSTNDPEVVNFGFEYPEVCEGFRDCTDQLLQPNFILDCVGIAPNPVDMDWRIEGKAGVSFKGWVGDVKSAEGRQHLYMAPTPDEFALVSQTVKGFRIGSLYTVSVMVGARSTANGGAAFLLTLGDPILDNTPSIDLPSVEYVLGKDSLYYETVMFIAKK